MFKKYFFLKSFYVKIFKKVCARLLKKKIKNKKNFEKISKIVQKIFCFKKKFLCDNFFKKVCAQNFKKKFKKKTKIFKKVFQQLFFQKKVISHYL